MERDKKSTTILNQFKKKTKKIVNKDLFTEFFYLNKNRGVIEFLTQQDEILIESFFKKLLPEEFKEFVNIIILNDAEEEIRTWYYDSENLVIVIKINWGFKKQEISIDIDINNFLTTTIDDNHIVQENIDYILFNDFLISFLTNNAKNLAQTFELITQRKSKKI